jgi:formylmethanofuran dehydrogenase subunit E
LYQLHEGTKYDKKAATKLASSGLFDEETSKKIVDALFREDIHAFVHSPSWLEKYLIGIVNMLIKYCDGSRAKAQEFLTDSIGVFEEYLTWVKEARPKLDQENQLALDKMFNEQWSYEDVVKAVNGIRQARDAESAEKLKNAEFDDDSDFELVEIESFEDFNNKFGGRATGDGSSDAYAGGGGTAWCHTNSEPTYRQWVKGGKKFFVLAHKDWENIPFDKESNSANPKDAYGNSLIAILVSKSDGRLLKATLRCNHVGVMNNADNQYNTYAELSEIAGFNVEEAVQEALENLDDDDADDVITCDNCGVVIEDDDEIHETPDGDTYCEDCFNENYKVCDGCGEVIDADYAFYTNYECLCQSCFDESYFYCDHCGDVTELEDRIETPDGWYCDYCAEKKGWTKCENCDEVISTDYAYYYDGHPYCDDCFHEYYFYCDCCGEDYDQDEMHDTPDGPVCDYCFRNNYFECGVCGEVFSNDDGVDTDNGWVCNSCYEEQQEEDDMDEATTTRCIDCSDDKGYDDLEDNFNLNEFLEKYGMR